MTSRIQTNRSTATGTRPPNTRPVGEFYVNFADLQFGVIDLTPAARDLLPIRWHSPTAAYVANDIVQQGGGLYQAKAAIPAHAFNANEWNQFFTNAQGDGRWLALTGGTLVGPLTLSGPPVNALHAATKTYVDAADATKLNLSGGTLTGPLILAADPSVPLGAATRQYADTKLPLAGGTLTGPLTLAGAPTSNLHAATKLYVDTADATKLPLAGGTLTGALTLAGAPTATLHAATKAYVDALGSSVAAGYLPLTGGAVSGNITAPAFVVSGSNGYLGANADYSVLVMDAANWQLRYTRATGRLAYIRGSDGVELIAVDGTGSLGVSNNVNAANLAAVGVVSGQQVSATLDVAAGRNVNAQANVNANGSVNAQGNVTAAGVVGAAGGDCWMGSGGDGRVLSLWGGYYLDFNVGNGDTTWVGNNSRIWVMRGSDGACFNNVAWVGGHGAYRDVSDERTKTDIAPASAGLPEILAIDPISFRRIGRRQGEVGFSAQNVQSTLPAAVTECGALHDGTPTLAVASEVILAAAVNAIKALHERVTVLEAT